MYTTKENLIEALYSNTYQFGNEPILFTHTDLDGVSCGVMFLANFGVHEDVFYLNNHEVDDRITETLNEIEEAYDEDGEEYRTIIISDLSVNERTAERLEMYVQKGGSVLLLDHHVTAEWLNRYTWAIVDTEASGALLLYNYLNIESRYATFATMVDDYDRWIHSDHNSIRLNRLFFLIGRKRFVKRFLENPNVEFTAGERQMLEIEEENKDYYMKKVSKTIQVYYDGRKQIGIGYADRFTSEIAHELMIKHNLHAIALIDVIGGRVSLRSISNYDVSELAESLGGGGHTNASGVVYHNKPSTHPLAKIQTQSVAIRDSAFEIVFRGGRHE